MFSHNNGDSFAALVIGAVRADRSVASGSYRPRELGQEIVAPHAMRLPWRVDVAACEADDVPWFWVRPSEDEREN